MHLIYLFFIAFVNSIDNIGIGVAYSVGRIKVRLVKNLLIAFIAFIVSYIASFSGDIISRFLSDNFCSMLSMIILVFMGIKMIYESYSAKDNSGVDKIKTISYKDALSIGLVLALDDIGSSVSSGLTGYNPFMVSVPYFVISIMIFFLSDYGTNFFSKLKIGKKATVISGVIMIIIGLSQLIE